MRIFRLHRKKDVNGNTGTGVVALGVEFPNGKVAMTWRTDMATVVIADSMTVIENLHGHEGATIVEEMELSPKLTKTIEDFVKGEDLKPPAKVKKKKEAK